MQKLKIQGHGVLKKRTMVAITMYWRLMNMKNKQFLVQSWRKILKIVVWKTIRLRLSTCFLFHWKMVLIWWMRLVNGYLIRYCFVCHHTFVIFCLYNSMTRFLFMIKSLSYISFFIFIIISDLSLTIFFNIKSLFLHFNLQ